MSVLKIIAACLVLLAMASAASVYTYGRFAKQARGEPSTALAVSDDATALDRMIAPILRQHPDQSGMILLASNLQAFAARAHSARSAARSLDLQYYYWRDDLTGGLLGKEVIAAANRGVRVRILLDDINTRGDDTTYLAFDSHPNIEVRLFNPSRNRANAWRRGLELMLRALSVNRRMHNKVWLADGRIAIVGGRNIGDAYFDAAETSNFRDMDLLLVGPAVQQTETVFDSYWNSASAIPIEALAGKRRGDHVKLQARLDTLLATGPAAPYLRRLIEERDTAAMLGGDRRFHWTAEAKVVSDPPEKATGDAPDHWLSHDIFPVLFAASREMEIVSPYFIPGAEGVSQLTGLAKRGVSVTVLTNSLAATDVTAVHGAYAPYRKPLLEGGVKLFELKPEIVRRDVSLLGSSGASLHTKAFTVDRASGFVGSFNFDPRSISLNTEMGVLFKHPELTEEIRKVIAQETAPQSSYRVILDEGALVWEDGAAPQGRRWDQEPVASLWRRLAATIVGFLPLESQF
jgi:putative cardiolipin synthase